MGGRLSGSDVRALVGWLLAAAIGLVVTVSLFPLALPEVAVDFRVGPQDATRIAREFLRDRQGVSLDDAISTSVLDVDRDAQVYLQREHQGRASELIAEEIPVFAFRTRFVRDQQQEEWAVRVDPAGKVVGMTHVVEEARPSARLSRDEARAVAGAWLRSVLPDLDRYSFVPQEAQSIERPARLDWTFSWERGDLGLDDAPYRVSLTVIGDAVGTYEQRLKVPDAFHREFARLRSENFLYQSAAQVLYVLLLAAALVTLVRLARQGAVRWRRTGVLLGVLFAAFLAFGLNLLPLELSRYDTKESYPGFVLGTAVVTALGMAVLAALTAVLWSAGEPLYRQMFPGRLRLSALWRPSALRSKEMFQAVAVGLAFAVAHLGFVIAFYVVGYRFGVWAPQDVRYSDVLATPAPWLAAIGLGILASTSEEFAFRLFAIPFLIRTTGSRVVAVVLPAIAWSFLHSSYPFEPGYVRGIEIGIVGIVAGWVFLRWGIVATLVWHYAYDAGLTGILLARAGETSFQMSGAIVALFVIGPLVALGLAYAIRRSFRTDVSVLNVADPVPPAPAAVARLPAVGRYQPASRRAIAAILAIGVGGLATYFFVPVAAIREHVPVAITADEAQTRADGLVRARGLEPAAFQRTASFGGYPTEVRVIPAETGGDTAPVPSGPSPAVHEYLRRHIGVDEATKLYAREAPLAFWRVRYFRDAEPEDHVVLLRPDGTPFAVWRRPDETAAGASLGAEEATAVAQRYLRVEQGLALERWRVVESASEKRPARTDHRIVLERLEGPAEARIRAEVRIIDRDVAQFRLFVKIPEAWERSFNSRDLAATILGIARTLLLAGVIVLIAILFFRHLRRVRIPWRTLALPAALAPATLLLAGANSARSVLAGYTTDLPISTYLGLYALSTVAGAALLFGVLLLVIAAAWVFASRAFGEERLVPSGDAWYFRDALLLGIGGTGAILGLGRLEVMANTLFPTDLPGAPVSLPDHFDRIVPALGPLLFGAVGSVVGVALAGLGFGLAATYVRRPFVVPMVLLSAVVVAYEPGPYEAWVKSAAVLAIQIGAVAWICARVVRTNLLAYALMVPPIALIGSALDLAGQPNAFYQLNSLVLALALVTMFAVPFARSWRTLVPGRAVAPVAPSAPPQDLPYL